MFGSSVRLRDGVASGSGWSREIDSDGWSASSRRAIRKGLDLLAPEGEGWILEHVGGGCHVFALYLQNGSGDYVYVSGEHDPLDIHADADSFGAGVTVGFYAGEQWDEMTYGEGVYFTEGIAEGISREVAIVDAVRRVFDAVGFTGGAGVLDWERIASAVSAGVCNRCGGSGVLSWQGVDEPCSGCQNIAEASGWVRPTV